MTGYTPLAKIPTLYALDLLVGYVNRILLRLNARRASSNPKPTPQKEKDRGHHTGVLYLLRLVDKKDATINISLTTLLQLKTRCRIRKKVIFAICSAF